MKKPKLLMFLKGGLGNQLFQLYTGLAVSREHGLELFLLTSLLPTRADVRHGVSRWPLALRHLPGDVRLIAFGSQPLGRTSLVSKFVTLLFHSRKLINKCQKRVQLLTDEEIAGQHFDNPNTELYVLCGTFGDGSNFLRLRETTNWDTFSKEPKLYSVRPKDVAIHLRLGDHLLAGAEEVESRIEFLLKALAELKIDNSYRLRVFSDDVSLALKLLPERYRRIAEPAMAQTDAWDTLMYLSSHQIIIGSPSTFSWWAGFFQTRGQIFFPSAYGEKLRARNLILPNHIVL